MPFVQGRLKNEAVTVSFRTECSCCGEPFRIDVDDELTYCAFEATDPLAFLPIVNFKKVADPSIVDVF